MHLRPPRVVSVSRSPFTSRAARLGRLSHCRCVACGLQRATLFLFVHSFSSSGFHVKLLRCARYCIVASPTFTFLQRLAYFPVAFRGGQMIHQRTKRQNDQIVFTKQSNIVIRAYSTGVNLKKKHILLPWQSVLDCFSSLNSLSRYN